MPIPSPPPVPLSSPATAWPLFGRAAKLRLLVSLLRRADVRAVWLSGPPGVGKTRLAHEAIRVASWDRAGVLLIDEPPTNALVSLWNQTPGVPPSVVVVTSRRPAAPGWGPSLTLAALSSPPDDASLAEFLRTPAAAMLIACARARGARFRLDPATRADLTHLCRIAEGLPGHLERLAHQLTVLTPAALRARIASKDHDAHASSTRRTPSRARD